ncbi:MAG TPA: ABC transporter ATP-binding protein [Acidimicrobiia bacterium]|nr:ABC transporter ATP-binding protein [Acidimicrobiia bacterium]
MIEAAGGILIFSVLGLLQDSSSGMARSLIRAIEFIFPDLSGTHVNVVLLSASAGFFVVRSLTLIGLAYAQARIAQSEGVRVARDLVSGYLAADYEFHLSAEPSVLIRNVMLAVDNVVLRFLMPMSRILSESLAVLALTTVLLFSAPVVTLVAAAGIGSVAWVVMRVYRPRFLILGRENQDLSATLIANVTESFEGIRDVIVTGSRWQYLEDFMVARKRLARTRVLTVLYGAVPRYVIETLLVVGILAFLALEVARGATEESIALIGLFSYTALRTLPAVNRITQAVNEIRYSKAAVDDVLSAGAANRGRSVRRPDPVERLQFSSDISVSEVSFGYAGSDRLILDGVDMTIRAGESIGIAGPTGSGKSTLIDLMLGLLRPSEGSVRIDNQDLGDVIERWHQTIGVVSQKVFTANASLMRNIALAGREGDVDIDRVWRCIEIAQLEQLVASLPDGIETLIGGAGVRLSGGERQRVAVARALYRDPSVLFLDEATSAIDGTTESRLTEALGSDNPSRTLITVAHRLNTLLTCDRIYVLLDGRIDAVGTYDELVSADGLFARMSERRHR